MCIEEKDWLTIIPNWLSAIGTLLAVIVALYLAQRDRQIKVKGSATVYILLDPDSPVHDEYVTVKVVNDGSRPFKVTNISWRTGIFKKTQYWQVPKFSPLSSQIPIVLNDGDEAIYHIPVSDFDENSKPIIIENMPKWFRGIWIRFCIVRIHTSTNKTINLKIQKNLREHLLSK